MATASRFDPTPETVYDLPTHRLPGGTADPTPDMRATWAALAIKAYAELVGETEESPETAIKDLLADVLHLIDALELDSDFVLSCARANYQDEV